MKIQPNIPWEIKSEDVGENARTSWQNETTTKAIVIVII